MGASSCEFSFRIWVHPELEDPPEIEVWYHGLEITKPGNCFCSEWALNALYDLQSKFWDIFDLDKTKHWQVFGRAVVAGRFDYYGEYDEDVDLIEFEKAEVPDGFRDMSRLDIGGDGS